MGRKSTQQGKGLQEYLASTNAFLLSQGMARVYEVPDPFKRTGGRGGRITGFYDTPVEVDFAGLICTGRHVSFEAKCTGHDTRFDFSHIERDRTITQREMLKQTASMGGIAFVYVRRLLDEWGFKSTDYILPVDADGVIADITDRKSLPWDRGEPFALERHQNWLDKVIELYDLNLTRKRH